MQANAATELRDWIGQIESALGVIISATDEGAFSLYTRGDRAILIEPVRGQLALVLTGALSETDETMSANLFRALLAANVVPGMAYPSSIGLHPAEQTLILRLLWAPAQDDWRGEAFLSCLRPLAWVDALAGAIASRQIESCSRRRKICLSRPCLTKSSSSFDRGNAI